MKPLVAEGGWEPQPWVQVVVNLLTRRHAFEHRQRFGPQRNGGGLGMGLGINLMEAGRRVIEQH